MIDIEQTRGWLDAPRAAARIDCYEGFSSGKRTRHAQDVRLLLRHCDAFTLKDNL